MVIMLLLVIAFIVLATSYWKLHPFLVLILAAMAMGLAGGLRMDAVMVTMTMGFGTTLQNIGIVIALGTLIGTFLEKSGGAETMAATVLGWVGEKKAPLAMGMTGFLVSIPVFCDSGFVVLSPLNRALSRRTGISMAVLAVALATGLYATHVFVPPTPGPLAAASELGASIGRVLFLGLIVAIPSACAGLIWALIYARRIPLRPDSEESPAPSFPERPGAIRAFLPILVPIILIALGSLVSLARKAAGPEVIGAASGLLPFFLIAPGSLVSLSLDRAGLEVIEIISGPTPGLLQQLFSFIGHPVTALLIGVFLAFFLKKGQGKGAAFDWINRGLRNAGPIILITGAGGAFGKILQETTLGENLGEAVSEWHIGIFLPFLIAAVLKTAQGSSTVAIVTTAAMIAPLVESMGLGTPTARALVVLAIGAGSMTVSHTNDSYFWVVSQFSGMDTATALRCHTLASLFQGLAGILTIALLTWILI
jgi:GntP family gluconate:H+ symporter